MEITMTDGTKISCTAAEYKEAIAPKATKHTPATQKKREDRPEELTQAQLNDVIIPKNESKRDFVKDWKPDEIKLIYDNCQLKAEKITEMLPGREHKHVLALLIKLGGMRSIRRQMHKKGQVKRNLSPANREKAGKRMKWMNAEAQRIRKDRPGTTFNDCMVVAGQRWNLLNKDGKMTEKLTIEGGEEECSA